MNQIKNINDDYAIKTFKEAKDLYQQIIDVYNKANYSEFYQQSRIWDGNSRNIRDMTVIMESVSNPIENYRLIQKNHFSQNPTGPIKEKLVDWYISYLKREGYSLSDFPSDIQESPVTSPEEYVERENRVLTPAFLRKVIQYLDVRKYCELPESKLRIVELGGGTGNLARVFKLFAPDCVYVGIDIPETLYYAYLFLKLSFQEAKVCYVTDESQLKNNLEDFDFIFIPTMFADAILKYKFDIFCNTASMGEMHNTVIRHWMDYIQNKIHIKFFFGLNRYLDTVNFDEPYRRHRIEENECSVLFDDRWKILKWELQPLFERCPFATNETSRNLQIIAQRLDEDSVSESDNKARSNQLVDEIKDELWSSNPGWYLSAPVGFDTLTLDLTMKGTLFKLWDSIRLDPNAINVSMMIIYLTTAIKRSRPFEELPYYRNLLNKIISTNPPSDEKVKSLSTSALELSKIKYAFSIIGFLPLSIRSVLIRLLRPISSRLGKMTFFRRGILRKARLY